MYNKGYTNKDYEPELAKSTPKKQANSIAQSVLAWLGVRKEAAYKMQAAAKKAELKPIEEVWKEAVGEQFALKTKLRVEKSTLFVKVQSPMLRHHLTMRQGELLTQIQAVHTEIQKIFWT